MKKKTFYCSNLAYYAKAIGNNKIETMISLSETEGGTHGEFAIRWVDLGRELVPQIQAFNDSWKALSEMPELIELFAENDSNNITQGYLSDLLKGIGYEDTTAYTDLSGKDMNQLNEDILLRTKNDLQKEIDKVNKKIEDFTNES